MYAQFCSFMCSPTIAATEISTNLCYLCTDLINYAISQVTGMQILDSTDQDELSFPKKGRMIFIEDPGHFVMNMNKRLLLQMINLFIFMNDFY